MSNIQIKRIYDPADINDGFRVLVDRMWPQGVSKQRAQINFWARDIAPSNNLRKAFHGTENWNKFKTAYTQELAENTAGITELNNMIKDKKKITLLYASKNIAQNNAVVLQEYLNHKQK